MKTIQEYMNDYYRASVIGKTDTNSIKNALAQAIEENPDMLADAKVKLGILKSVSDRCFISKIHAQLLAEVLNG